MTGADQHRLGGTGDLSGHTDLQDFCDPVVTVAQRLLNATLTSHIGFGGADRADAAVVIRVTEVEAYGGVGADEASHAHRGMTRRNEPMFGAAGLAYVYFVYGMHWCLNVVTGAQGQASAVLIRAGEVTVGHDIAAARRGTSRRLDLANGPAKLAQALGIDSASSAYINGVSLLAQQSPIALRLSQSPVREWRSGPRIGVADQRPWRFWLADEPTVSRARGPR